ncbi:Zn-dependent hydrolase [Priestia megaterium]|uniref:Amidase, hydantoinase/carbamoylase family protein n=1 Tax=Priestia megaterium (strain ATCC 14581 / DSM 32 / CCUG 1817 / JCM 2506 / NBRC 15308 / NCIMB 9376 / NCTC 10342 / NRRL B-14308 / VKM B-512 / Ford 19) TaxID=1348623 RepID=A0A0B6AKL2_PRIM2|nr:Zn-dependent hydrolase [Priestia megaterium]AJI24066.1 amidase, hydantoinase/carbamoylase family protein [Priestia megaterium NBRC 15308 = ATCC 14581]KFM97457.1 amidase, hydantoinase/carbamoylase family protein [Priestia megaterium]KGJ84750.1 allantoate amidohydrolase [Priestia megaterium NBRC 15308 = ATCC 14581]MBU8756261.1 Zn-dependent hydrolase [Priestia megaterium]MDH3186764.1 Zn-dependent hydrolase [Priestia megaterium]
MQRQKVAVNGERLKNTLERFAEYGRTPNNGVTRLALSEEDRLARDYFCSCCRDLGMDIKIDDLGCIYATLEGVEDKPPVVIGSHMDSVKKGGRFDGILGVVAGLELVRTLVEHNIKPKVPITIVNFTNEEGARFEPSMMASGILSGKFQKDVMMKKMDVDGVTFEQALQSCGYEGDTSNRLTEASAFVELHIEQGPILEREAKSIGVVECVLGMVCYEIEVTGESDHAGTTPMDMRKDALFATNNLIAEARHELGRLDSNLVYTMGRMNVLPNIHTVIPNKVIFSLEARHTDEDVIASVEKIIQLLPDQAELLEGCEVRVTKLWGRDTVWFDKTVCDEVEESVRSLGYSYKRMVSGAGHDAQFLASYIPTAMIFIPSVNGKSHCEEEFTPWEECEKGVNVLLETVIKLAQK